MATRRGTPRWARVSSLLIAAAVWIWVIYVIFVSNWASWEQRFGTQLGTLVLNIVFFVMVATVMAVFAMFLVRLIGRGVAWLKLRF